MSTPAPNDNTTTNQPPTVDAPPTTQNNSQLTDNLIMNQRREIGQRLLQIFNAINPQNQHQHHHHNVPTVLTEVTTHADDDNTRLVNQTEAPDTTTTNPNTNNNATNAQPPPETGQEQDMRMNRDEMISASFRIIPLVVLPFVLIMYDHYVGILVFAWFMWMLWSANERIKAQVALNETRSIILTLALMILLGLQITLVIFIFSKMQLYLYFGMLAPEEKLDFWNSLFVVVIIDSMIKAVSMFAKCGIIVIAPLFLKNITRSRMYSFTENLFCTYRCILPIPVWTRFMLTGYYNYFFAGFVLMMYGIFKLRSFYENVRKVFISLVSIFRSTAQYGNYASQEEITELGDPNCSICHDEFTKPIKLDCGHFYCEECISSWFNTSNKTCPVCRQVCNDAVKLTHTDGGSSLGVTLL